MLLPELLELKTSFLLRTSAYLLTHPAAPSETGWKRRNALSQRRETWATERSAAASPPRAPSRQLLGRMRQHCQAACENAKVSLHEKGAEPILKRRGWRRTLTPSPCFTAYCRVPECGNGKIRNPPIFARRAKPPSVGRAEERRSRHERRNDWLGSSLTSSKTERRLAELC